MDVDVTCERAVESVVMMLSSDVSVAHAECAIGLRNLATSGDAGRREIILRERNDEDGHYVLVKWRGMSKQHATWEPAANIMGV